MGHVQHAFPDFDDTLPEIEGFQDMSYKNDTAPHLLDRARRLKLWVDYKDPQKSEHAAQRLEGTMHRYHLINTDEDGEPLDTDVISTNDLDEVLQAIAALDAAATNETAP